MNLIFKSITFVFLVLIISILNSCNSDDGTVNCFPTSTISATYNINLPAYSDLQNTSGYVVLNPDGTNGSRGLILVNTGTSIRAYDRNAPHICPNGDSTLEVEDDIKIVCPHDGAEWILLTGQPINDETLGKTPRQYNVQVNGSVIIITN